MKSSPLSEKNTEEDSPYVHIDDRHTDKLVHFLEVGHRFPLFRNINLDNVH